MDFNLKMYGEILKALRPYMVVTVERYLKQSPKPPLVILRHDVDRELGNALAMAELEHRFGINSTYYFRYPRTFNVKVMSRIHSLGHEIGYHYEALDKAGGDPKKAMDIFQRELDIFRRYFPVTTVCRHGNPLTKWDGREIWEHYDFKDYGLIGEAYISCAGVSHYLTDTGRNWCGNGNLKDTLNPKGSDVAIRNTCQLIAFLKNHRDKSIYLNCHPERWGPGIWGWLRALIRDNTFNLCKFVIKKEKKNFFSTHSM
ncbi:MAG: hypothetical protein GX088_07710 [Clostridia bacterium]|nr:hypothetical protein [Clostridia bacterium]